MKTRVWLSHRARRIFIVLHLWLGLFLGAWFSLIGVTGSILAWRTDLSPIEFRWRHPLEKPAGNAQMITLSEAIRAVQTAHPELPEEQLATVTVPNARSDYYTFSTSRNRRTAKTLLVNPYTGSVSDPVASRTGFVATTNQLHARLIAGMRGYAINGLLTALAVPLLLSGLWLWWPSTVKQLKARLTVKKGTPIHRKLYDLHNVMGIYLYSLLLITTVTGVLIVVAHVQRDGVAGFWAEVVGRPETEAAGGRGEGRRAEGRAGERRNREGEGQRGEGRGAANSQQGRGAGGPGGDNVPTVEPQGQRLSDDELLAAARKAVPNQEINRIRLPLEPNQAFQASYAVSTGFSTNRDLFINPYTGQPLEGEAVAAASQPRGGAYNQIIRGLHFGEFGGVITKLLYTFTGLMPLGLFLTGLWMWARKKFKRARKGKPAATTPQELVNA